MTFEPSDDQTALLDALERIATRHAGTGVLGQAAFESSPALQADLDAAGLLDAAGIDGLGAVAATLLVARLARLPQVVEAIAAALVVPLLAPDLPRPCAVLWDRHDRPARFLPGARSVLLVEGARVASARIDDADVEPLESPFGYPVGRLRAPSALAWTAMPGVAADSVRRLWRIGLAAELAGVLGAGLDAVVEHVRDRRQFGRPLGAFQAVQHRLAEAAVRVEATRWMALRAAGTADAAAAAAAAGYAQESAATVVYDLHQFMGAMGLTLEHPLHRWTTRAKMLRADLGGADAQFEAAADAAWGPTAAAVAAR